MLMEHAASRSLRAPQGDGQKVIEPPWPALPEVVHASRDQLARADYDVQGRSLRDLALNARAALLQQALAFTRQYRGIPQQLENASSITGLPFVLAGHQPQLFHPGVWYKNFVLGALARQIGGVGIHLLIDSDLCRTATIRVPTGSIQEPRLETMAYDEPSYEVPYEERAIREPRVLRSFAERLVAQIRPFVPDPMVTSLWPLVLDRNPQQMNLGLRLAQGRHALEETWRNETLGLPQSVVCRLPEFAWFVAHVLAHLPASILVGSKRCARRLSPHSSIAEPGAAGA
jgi:hypothetical protein